MRFKLSIPNQPKHTEAVNCVAWTTSDEIYSIGDDHTIIKSNLVNNETQKLVTLSEDIYPLDMQWLPKTSGQGGRSKSAADIFAMAASDGRFFLMSKNGKMEKSVDAHKGSCICIRWSSDGTMLLTAGEDGAVKLWSKLGMLRSTLVQSSTPVYSVAWSADNESVLYASGRNLHIKPLSANAKAQSWKAHDGIVLTCDWNPVNNLIISGGEDCRYKLWDTYGRQLYSSYIHEYPITSLAWAPDGELFAVGSYNTLRLCDKAGWSHSLEKPNIGSMFSMSWSNDSTQLACGCGSGHVVVGNVIEKLEWRHFEFIVSDTKQIKVRNCENDAKEELDLKDRVLKMSAGFGYLIAITPSQCYVYSIKTFNTPAISELKESCVTLIVQSEKNFLLIDGAGIYIYSYDGRIVSAPKWQSMRTELLNVNNVSISNDTIAVRDFDQKNVLFFEITGKPIGDGKPMSHSNEIVELALDQAGTANERRLAFVDKNRDLYLTNVRTLGTSRKVHKLGSNISSFVWNDAYNMLAGIADSRFTVWYYPSIVYVDKSLLARCMYQRDASEFGKSPALVTFLGNNVTMRTADGSVIHTTVPPYASVLLAYVASNKWDDALKLCRFVKETSLWAILAGAAIHGKDLETASYAYAALNEVDKVEYIEYIKQSPNRDIKNAETALLCGNFQDAEAILLQSNQIFRAIMLNLYQYNWDRALELAVKHQSYLDIVIGFRQRYLEEYDKQEKNKQFLKYRKEVDVDMDTISSKIEQEFLKERSGGSSGSGGGVRMVK